MAFFWAARVPTLPRTNIFLAGKFTILILTGSILKRSLKAFFNSGLVANLGTLKVITPSSLSTLAFSVIRGIFKRARQSTPAFLRFGNQNVFRIEKKNGIEVSNIFYSDRRYISKAFKNFWII